MDSWRTIDSRERAFYVDDVTNAVRERVQLGHERYGSKFVGDPLEQAWEEALDLLFYLWVQRRKEA